MIKIKDLKVLVDKDSFEYLRKKIVNLLKIKETDLEEVIIKKKSLDARSKEIFFVYEVDVRVKEEGKVVKNNKGVRVYLPQEYKLPCSGAIKLTKPIAIVGAGPAGLFAAYMLALRGYKPLIFERGKRIEERVKDVELFWQKGILNPDSNVQFGEGGAGTFSDGKLNTRVKDKENRLAKILEIFIEQGAPEEIAYIYNPHIGTDILRKCMVNLRNTIRAMGGEFYYEAKLTGIKVKDNTLEAIVINDKEEIPCSVLVLAIGHSARDTFEMLRANRVKMEAKPFAVGVRVMHKQKDIDAREYHDYAEKLGPASYKLTYTTKSHRGVYSFCMCPGGYVVNASSEEGHLAINGMSNYARNSGIANSAIVVTVTKDDFGPDLFGGLNFQRDLERKAYALGQGSIPIQTWADYRDNKLTTKEFQEIKPEFKGAYKWANLQDIFSDYINSSIIEAMEEFAKKIPCFKQDNTILAGVESRTSSPIRILRNEELEANIKGIYPCGEGAGYAGGIMSSACDGVKVAEEIIKKYFV